MAKSKISITIDDDLNETIRQLAEKEERTVSQQITYLLKLGLETYWEKKGQGRE